MSFNNSFNRMTVIRTISTRGITAKKYKSEPIIEPQLNAGYGNLFNADSGFQIEPDVYFNVDGIDNRKCIFNRKVLTYLICSCKPDSANYYLPFPYPFIAITQNDGKAIRSYYKRLNYENEELLTNQRDFEWVGYQRDLNELCYEMFEQVKQIDQLKGAERRDVYNLRMEGFIDYWREAINALDYERYVSFYDLPDLKYWSRLPTMKNTSVCELYHNATRIIFLLKEHVDRYSLEMIISANEKVIPLNDDKRTLFLTTGKKIYLVDHSLEEQLLNWMFKSKGKLTVFKNDFPAFHENYLSQICRAYQVGYLPVSSTRTVPYTFEIKR